MKAASHRKVGVVDMSRPMTDSGGTAVKVIYENHEAAKVFIQNFKKEIRKQWQDAASRILSSGGLNENVLETLNIKALNELEDCASPLRKKQKSNEHVSSKARLPVVSYSSSLPEFINHGLSDMDLARIHKLKKVELIKEIQEIGGEYHKSWSKGALLRSLLTAYASFNLPQTQMMNCKIEATSNKDSYINQAPLQKVVATWEQPNIISDFEFLRPTLGAATSANVAEGNNVQIHSKLEAARTLAADQRATIGKDETAASKKSIHSSSSEKKESDDLDDCMSVSSIVGPRKLAVISDVEKESNMDVDEPAFINQRVPSPNIEMEDDEEFETAKENYSQSQSSQFKLPVVAKYYVPSLCQIPGSDVKPPRSSPTTVPFGIVNSAKKQLLSSQKKAQLPDSQTFVHSNVPQKLDLDHKEGIVKSDKQQTNRILAIPAFDSSNGPSLLANSGFSEKVKASTEARNERIAQVRALSKKTSQKTSPSTFTSTSSGTELVNSHVNLSSLSSKFHIKDRLADIRAKKQKQEDQSLRSVNVPVPLDAVNFAQPKPVASIKKKSPTLLDTLPSKPKQLKEVFVSYEMTDGEYDSDDDINEARKTKLIPDWARSANLAKALEVQYSKKYPIDPDELFGEVETCNLEAIFSFQTSKYRRRNSSGDWTKDRVTSTEKRMYKLQVQ